MKKKLTALLAIGAIALSACGGVDRSGSRDEFIKQLKDATGLDADGACIDKVLDQYSDDELKNLDKTENLSSPEADAFATKLFECVDLNSGGG